MMVAEYPTRVPRNRDTLLTLRVKTRSNRATARPRARNGTSLANCHQDAMIVSVSYIKQPKRIGVHDGLNPLSKSFDPRPESGSRIQSSAPSK